MHLGTACLIPPMLDRIATSICIASFARDQSAESCIVQVLCGEHGPVQRFFRPDCKSRIYLAHSPAGERQGWPIIEFASSPLTVIILKEIFLECPDDNAAKEAANQLVDGHDVELWQHERLVAKFVCKPK